MKRNLVLIETISGTGSGILYPCKYHGKNKQKHINYYIVFTNKHVLKDIQENSKPDQSVKELIILQIYDDTETLIEKNDIIDIFSCCAERRNYNKSEDIAALLVAIKDNIRITLDTSIYQDILANRDIIYLEGYPGILLDDEVSQKIQLQGITKSMFPESKKIGVFQITDDYHWYNNLYDLDLFKGMSGGPVYRESEGKTFLLGMIQSVSALDDGQNPFKLVYYLRIEFVLEYLRTIGCILFRKVGGMEYQVEWIFGMENEISKYINNPSFLLIGGSGAGKSSFAKDFAYHGTNLLTTNDGQTTRMTVGYEYSIFCNKPKATVGFMSQLQFCDRMSELQGAMPILRIIRKIFKLRQDIVKNEVEFLESCYYFLERLQNSKKLGTYLITELEEYLDSKRRDQNCDSKEQIKTYEKLIVLLIRYFPITFVKCIFDKEWIEDIKKQYYESYEKQYCSEDEQKNWLNRIIEDNHLCDEKECDNKYRDTLYKFINGEYSFRDYQKTCIDNLINNKEISKVEIKRKLEVYNILDNFRLEYLNELLYAEGFFNIEELLFLNMFKNQNIKLEDVIEANMFPQKESRKNAEEAEDGYEIDIWEGTQNIYKGAYQIIKKAICEEYDINQSDFKRIFDLSNMNDQKKKELQLCLQVNSGKSLTGMIQFIKIQDMVSNEYAMLFSELKIRNIRLYDTYGLDHVEEKNSIENTLYSHVYSINENDRIRFKDMNVLYFKKLDAGRPDELRIVLPCVRKVIPQAPVYCVFTGVDIFYKTPEEVRKLQWRNNEDERVPKSVRYILSERGRFALTNKEVGKNEKNKNMYLVLRNNLIPYCGKKEKVLNEYYFYRNNEIYVRRLLASIIMKEYSSLEIVDMRQFENLSSEVMSEIKKFILEIFKRASVNISGVHWNTIRANIKNIDDNKILGKSTSFRYQWNQRFHEAYSYVVDKFGGELASRFCGSKDAIEAALRNVEDSFLGSADNLCKLEIENKNKFRIYMELMYESDSYENNPYKTSKEQLNYILSDNVRRKEFFSDVFDFAKGIKNHESLLKQFVKEFVSKLRDELINDNKIKAENIIHLNASFAEAVEIIKTEFIEKYSVEENDNDVERNFKEVLKAYIASLK